ncbi:hypothetical protein ACFL3F_04820, partial [Planctomycetota bacterium]
AARRFFDDHKEKMLKGTQVLWPEHENYYDLMVYQQRYGKGEFMLRKQNKKASHWVHQQRIKRMREQMAQLQAEFENSEDIDMAHPSD